MSWRSIRAVWLLASVTMFACQFGLLNVSAASLAKCGTFSGFAVCFDSLMTLFLIFEFISPLAQQPDSNFNCFCIITTALAAFGLYTAAIIGAIVFPSSPFWSATPCYPVEFSYLAFVYTVLSTLLVTTIIIWAMLDLGNRNESLAFQSEPGNLSGRLRGLTEAELMSIEVVEIPPTAASVSTCAICLEPCVGATKLVHCGHRFHAHCIDTWLKQNNSCALCRSRVTGSN